MEYAAGNGRAVDARKRHAGLLEMIGTRQACERTIWRRNARLYRVDQPLSAIQPPNSAAPLATTPECLVLGNRLVWYLSQGSCQPIVVHTWWQREGPGNGETGLSIG